MRLGMVWPPEIEGREPGVLYAWYPADWYHCSCGERVKNLASITVASFSGDRPPQATNEYRFQHGDNPEAVFTTDNGFILDERLERELAEWTERVHAYERVGVHG